MGGEAKKEFSRACFFDLTKQSTLGCTSVSTASRKVWVTVYIKKTPPNKQVGTVLRQNSAGFC